MTANWLCVSAGVKSYENGQSADCNKVIIIVTDELDQTYEQVLTKYNSPDKLVSDPC